MNRALFLFTCALAVGSPNASMAAKIHAEKTMHHAKGTFTVKVQPTDLAGPTEDAQLGRMTIEKEFAGELVGTGRGQMLTAMTPVKGSMAYVAIERVSGTLAGRRGTFVLQHKGVMIRGGGPPLEITVVPDSGTDELLGIEGTLIITIVDGRHDYDFEYSLPEKP